MRMGALGFVQAIAGIAVLVGTAGVVFADANAEGCKTRLIRYTGPPVTYALECVDVSCGHSCSPATMAPESLYPGDVICSCSGSTSYATYVAGGETKCVGRDHFEGGNQSFACDQQACTTACVPDNSSFPGGQYFGCKCP